MKLTAKRILITGGTAGIGRELVDQLAPANELIVVGRNLAKLTDLVRLYPSVSVRVCDLADSTAVARLALSLQPIASTLDGLIFNAAIQHTPWISDPAFEPASVLAEIATNFTSICQLTAALGPHLRRGSGRNAAVIGLINSGLALVPKRDSAVYCATKAAVRSFGRSIGYQLAGQGVRVTQIYLPLVDTGMTRGRGSRKLAPDRAARAIITGLESGRPECYVGKSRILHRLHRISPAWAQHIMRRQ